MSKELSRNQSGYSERELIIYRCITLFLYSLIILAILVIGPLLAIHFQNPYYALYSLAPASLFIPMRMFIDRFFPRFTTTESTPHVPTNVLRLPIKGKVQPDP
jgi:hypothetical protein